MYVCWSRLSFGDSVRARFQKLNLAKNTKIRVSVKRNRGLINCSAASSSEVFKGLYRTNACPECFDSFWLPHPLTSVLAAGRGEWLLIQSSPRPPIVHKPDKVAGHAVVHGEWQATEPPRPRLPLPAPPAVLSPQLPPPNVMDNPQPAMLS